MTPPPALSGTGHRPCTDQQGHQEKWPTATSPSTIMNCPSGNPAPSPEEEGQNLLGTWLAGACWGDIDPLQEGREEAMALVELAEAALADKWRQGRILAHSHPQ